MLTHVVSCCLGLLPLVRSEAPTYRLDGNPYLDSSDVSSEIGHLRFPLRLGKLDNPLYSHIYYPKKSGKYPFFYFIPGLYGEIPVYAYKDLLEKFTKKGMVIGVSSHVPDFRIKQAYELWEGSFEWFQAEANQLLETFVDTGSEPLQGVF